MKLLEKGVYKVFAGLVLVSMIGALVAEPVVLGDLGAYYLTKDVLTHKYDAKTLIDDGGRIALGYDALTGGLSIIEGAGAYESALLITGACLGGAAVAAIGAAVIF